MRVRSRREAMHATTLDKRVKPRSDRWNQELQRNLQRYQNLKATRLHALWAKWDYKTNLEPDQCPPF